MGWDRKILELEAKTGAPRAGVRALRSGQVANAKHIFAIKIRRKHTE